MVKLSKLDRSEILLSFETVKYIEAIPDTLIHFLNGDSVIVRERLDEVIEKTEGFMAHVLAKASIIKNSSKKEQG